MVEEMTEGKDEDPGLDNGNWRRVWPAPIKPLEDELLSTFDDR